MHDKRTNQRPTETNERKIKKIVNNRISRIDRTNLDQLSSCVLCVYFSFFLSSIRLNLSPTVAAAAADAAALALGKTNANIIEFKSF